MGDEDKDSIPKVDFDKWKSKMDGKIAEQDKQIKELAGAKAQAEAELADAKIASDDPEQIEQLRKQHVELTKAHKAVTKERDDAKAELSKTQIGASRSKIATEYKFGELKIEESILDSCETERDMELVAAKAKIAKLEEAPPPPPAPEKDKFGGEKPTGAGGEEVDKMSSRQAFAGHLEDKEAEGK